MLAKKSQMFSSCCNALKIRSLVGRDNVAMAFSGPPVTFFGARKVPNQTTPDVFDTVQPKLNPFGSAGAAVFGQKIAFPLYGRNL